MSASIVSVSATENFLVLTNDKAGANIVVTEAGDGTVLSGLGLSTTNGLGNLRSGIAAGNKVETADGFSQILFDGSTGDSAYITTYDSGTRDLTLTRGDGESETVTLVAGAIGAGLTESAVFGKFGITLVLDETFDKAVAITVAADTVSVTGGTGVIDAASIKIFDSEGDVSAITSTTLTFGNLAAPASFTVTAVGGFTGTVDASTTGVKTVTLSDGKGNELLVQFDVTTAFDANSTAASIELHELENLIATNDTQFSSVLQETQTARITADGLTDPTHFESKVVTSKTAALTNFAANATFPGGFDIVGTATSTISYAASDTLESLRDKVNAVTGTTGVTARIIKDPTGFRLDFTAASAFSFTDTNGLTGDLGINDARVITRQTNTVGDLYTGITLSLFQPEAGTTVKIEIEQDLGVLKTEVEEFVGAYNALRRFINTHNKFDSTTGAKAVDAGVLFGDSVMGALQTQLASIVNGNVDGVASGFSVLSQIGVELVNNSTVADALDKETLVINNSKLDEALLNNPEDTRRLLAFDFNSSNPNVVLVDHTVKTTFSASGYTLNVNFDDRLEGTGVTNNTVFAQTDAETGGPASDGVGAITFGNSVVGNQAFRYSYDNTTEQMTLINLTTGASEVRSVAAPIDAATGVGEDLAASETANIVFASLDTTITLSGDNGFLRATPVSDGTLDNSLLAPNMAMTGGAATTPTTGMNKATVDALVAAGAYNQANGLLTLGIGSTGFGEAHVNTAAGIKFNIDGGGVLADISATDLDDGLPHTIGVFVNDGAADIQVATLSFATLTGAALDAGKNITIDLGTGLIAESATITSATAPMSNYFTLTDGSFEIRDSNSVLLGTVNYLAAESVTDVAATVSAISGVTGTVIASGNTFFLSIASDTNDAITVQADTGGLVAQHAIVDTGSKVFAANYNGPANGTDDTSAIVSTNVITATGSSGAEGLKVLFTGSADASGIQIDFTIGIGARLFFELDQILDVTNGSVQGQIAVLEGRNELAQDRVDALDRRLDVQRESLLARFIAAELALSSTSNLIESIKQTFAAFENGKK